MKKTICSLLIIIILMNFTLCNFSYAAGQEDGTGSNSGYYDPAPVNPSTSTELMENGTDPDGQEIGINTAGITIIGTIFGYLSLICWGIVWNIHSMVQVFRVIPTLKIYPTKKKK